MYFIVGVGCRCFFQTFVELPTVQPQSGNVEHYTPSRSKGADDVEFKSCYRSSSGNRTFSYFLPPLHFQSMCAAIHTQSMGQCMTSHIFVHDCTCTVDNRNIQAQAQSIWASCLVDLPQHYATFCHHLHSRNFHILEVRCCKRWRNIEEDPRV